MALQSIKDKTALVTGASRGIGKAIALALAAEGVNLALTARSAGALTATVDECRRRGHDNIRVEPFAADFLDPAAPGRLMEAAAARFGKIDFLINNAGCADNVTFEETTMEQWERFMSVNARAPFFLCQAALQFLRKSDAPVIINVSSVVGRQGYPNQAAYGASKHALLGFTKAMAREVQKDGIRVYALSPGATATDLIRSMRPDLDSSVLIAPEELAEIAVFLLKFRGNAMVDEINVRRDAGTPWAG
ncbi:MAG: SDR family oxidoreductase [Spirochaetales bacterium]|nr:MAG: SDR family oxidoreductase [Spirochaetales bacterium]